MRWHPHGCVLLLLAGCLASPPLPPAGTGAMPADEQRIWAESREAQERWRRSGFLIDDPALQAYLDDLARRLLADEPALPLELRIEVVRDLRYNAMAYPNGVIYIHAGLLARMENEAQLATLLGHELTHATHRHGIKTLRQRRSHMAFQAIVAHGTGGIGNLLTGWVTLAGVSGYSRELEAEADAVGWQRTRRLGYAPAESVRLFAILAEDIEKEPGRVTAFFFSSHPALQDRVVSYERLLRRSGADPEAGLVKRDTFLRHTAGVRLDVVQLELQAGRFDRVDAALERAAAAAPDAPQLDYLLGERHRLDPARRDPAAASAAYRRCLARDPQHAAACRSLGLLLVQEGQAAEAEPWLRRYLELRPDCTDRAFILQYL
jgi:predicted Zn-dependent protease